MSEDIEGTVRDLERFGDGVVKTEQGAIFAPGTLPGERVRLGGVRKQGKVLRAERVQIIDASTQRVEPVCPIVARCGGCPLMIASLPLQEKFRRDLITEALQGIPGAEAVALRWVGTRQAMGYRLRARMSWTRSGRGLRFGYFAPRSDQIADVRSCGVLHPALDRAQAALRRAAGDHLAGDGEVHLAMGEGGRPVVHLGSEAPQAPELYRAVEELVLRGTLAGAALRSGGASRDATFGDPREVRVAVDGEPLYGTIAGFSQAHDEVNRALVLAVVELARPVGRDVLELFSGTGNLTVALARGAKSIVAVEMDEAAAAACRDNARRRGLEVTVRADDAEAYRSKLCPDVAVIDPPRTGAEGAVTRLAKLGVKELVYVSCDPPTLARDLRILARYGFAITDAVGLDMFPQTAHVEAIVRVARG